MAIQNRRGAISKLNPDKLLPGEFAVSLDNKELYLCFSPGEVKRIANEDDKEEIMEKIKDLSGNVGKLIVFEIDDDGYFIMNVPDETSQFVFSMTSDGRVEVEY